jgi:hypothetical protein
MEDACGMLAAVFEGKLGLHSEYCFEIADLSTFGSKPVLSMLLSTTDRVIAGWRYEDE